ncbi:hypothetical protein DPMN_107220 [Dreissena polymorpha]|uniref:Uncharacterized protein n=1 Tax=Dreissena polymorpha TaxID=45954 RepID=A0A9D4K6L5_DREPO|nr:hypothetical protein DPMN_107220 [Dreissena polymorpha]
MFALRRRRLAAGSAPFSKHMKGLNNSHLRLSKRRFLNKQMSDDKKANKGKIGNDQITKGLVSSSNPDHEQHASYNVEVQQQGRSELHVP